MRKNYALDMTCGPFFKKILIFSVPLMLTGLLQLAYNTADVVVVGRFVGKEALAAVGSTGSLINLFVNLFIGIALGSNVIIAHAVGQTFQTIMTTYPISLAATALMIFIALLWYRPSKLFAAAGSGIS